LDTLWSPWRNEYIASASKNSEQKQECVFCALRDASEHDEQNYVVHRAAHSFVVLNIYPYTSGHLLVIPYEHTGDLDAASKESTDELMDLLKRCQTALRAAYEPEGINIGMNLGKAAGAGVADHIHFPILPRWFGDTNFMTSVGDARVIPEDLATTYQKIRARF
jgi:ATP adenylyltransferase